MEAQEFKLKLKAAVKEYLDLDNQIITLQKAIRERKKRKEDLSKIILGAMKNNEIQQMNLKEDKLVYCISQHKKPMNKDYLNHVLNSYFKNEEKASDVLTHIFENRQRVEKVRLKRVVDKKKGIELNDDV
jgi:predicted  nucleic acid-binding Zn-ribbon protein